MDENSSIIDVKKLEDLKHLVSHNRDDIFLIDDAKIIKKDALNGKFKSKLKFLIPKDGIEEEFLFEHGVGDISFDSIEELSKHITDKIKNTNNDDDFENRDEIQESISNIVNDAYNEEDDAIQLNDELSTLLVSNDDFDEDTLSQSSNKTDKQAEDEVATTVATSRADEADALLDSLMSVDAQDEVSNVASEDDLMKELEELSISNDDFTSDSNSKKKNSISESNGDTQNQLEGLDITNADFNGTISKSESASSTNTEDIQGDIEMAGDFSSLDDISENDIIAALNGEEVAISETQVLTTTKKNEPVSVNINNTDDISELLSKLLKNKTLEITVKIKD